MKKWIWGITGCFLSFCFWLLINIYYCLYSEFTENLIIQIVGNLVAFAGAYIVYVLGNNYSKKKAHKESQELAFKKLHYFSSMIGSVLETVKQQKKEFKTYCDKVNLFETGLPLLGRIATINLKRFTEIQNHEEYYVYYCEKFGYNSAVVEQYTKIYSSIDYFKISLDELFEKTNKFQESDFLRLKECKNQLEDFLDKTANLLKSTENKDEFLNSQIIKYYEMKLYEKSIFEITNTFTVPILKEIISKIEYNELIDLLSKFNKKTQFINNLRQAFLEDILKQYINDWDVSIEKLEKESFQIRFAFNHVH